MKLPNLDFRNLRGDFYGGLTAAVVSLPLALAMGVQSGLGPMVGLYGAIGLGIFAALLGGTPAQVSGPTGPMTLFAALVVGKAAELYGSIEAGLWFVVAVFLLGGLFQIALGLLRLANYVEYIPYPVVSGFMSGIGIVILLLQVHPFLGYLYPNKFFDVFTMLPGAVQNFNVAAAGFMAATVLITYVSSRFIKFIPSTMVALLVCTSAAHWGKVVIPTIGDLYSYLPSFTLPVLKDFNLSHFDMLLEWALAVALIGAMDSLMTSVIAVNVTKRKHNCDQEMIGQGIGNMVAGVMGGIPGGGAIMRTLVNINSGGKTQLSGAIHGFVLLIILLALGKYAAMVPLATLAGIMVAVGIGCIDFRGLKQIGAAPQLDSAVMVGVMVVTVIVGPVSGLVLGLILSSVLFMRKMSEDISSEFLVLPLAIFKDELASVYGRIPEELAKKIFIKPLQGPFFFGFSSGSLKSNDAFSNIKVLIFQMKKISYFDQSGLYALEEAILDLEKHGVLVLMAGLQPQPEQMCRRINLVPGLIPDHLVFPTLADCAGWVAGKLAERDGKMQKILTGELQQQPGELPLKHQI
jgi:SulP family sulfate permease